LLEDTVFLERVKFHVEYRPVAEYFSIFFPPFRFTHVPVEVYKVCNLSSTEISVAQKIEPKLNSWDEIILTSDFFQQSDDIPGETEIIIFQDAKGTKN